MSVRVVTSAGLPIRRLISIGFRGTIYKQGYGTIPAAGQTIQWPFLVHGVTSATRLRVMYGNMGRGGFDAPPSASIRISSTLLTPVSDDVADYPIGDGGPSSHTPVRVTFEEYGGDDDYVIAPNDWVLSDVIPGVTVFLGDAPMFRTFVRSVTGSGADIQVPSDWSTAHQGEANSWDCNGDATENMSATKLALPQHFVYTPMALLAEQVTM